VWWRVDPWESFSCSQYSTIYSRNNLLAITSKFHTVTMSAEFYVRKNSMHIFRLFLIHLHAKCSVVNNIGKMICLNLQTIKLFSRILKNIGAWDSIAGELSRLWAGKWRNRFVFAPKCPARFWCPPSFLLNGKSGNFPGRYCGRAMKLATYLHLMPSLRMSGPVHLHPLCLQGLH